MDKRYNVDGMRQQAWACGDVLTASSAPASPSAGKGCSLPQERSNVCSLSPLTVFHCFRPQVSTSGVLQTGTASTHCLQ